MESIAGWNSGWFTWTGRPWWASLLSLFLMGFVSVASASAQDVAHHKAGANSAATLATHAGADNALRVTYRMVGSADSQIGAATALPATGACRQMRVAVLRDATRSTKSAGIVGLSVAEVAQLADVVRICGGRLAVGNIVADALQPMARLEIHAAPEALPAMRKTGIVLTDAVERQRYAKQVERHANALAGWRARSDTAAARFLKEVAVILRLPAEAGHTAWCAALMRADAFLGEPEGGAGSAMAPELFLLAQTDGVENVWRRPCAPLRNQITVLLVNGLGSQGNAADNLHVILFERQEGAISFLQKQAAANANSAAHSTSTLSMSGEGRGGR